ncbi:MAG: four helix bundle protein [Cloacibacterium sp.]|nr:four helix bundle protein [Cloacibacterium sp.]
MRAHRLHDLQIWLRSITLVKNVYILTKDLPSEEKFGLISQIRRCAVSIPSNIAEGAGRNNVNEFIQFLGIAFGSTYELETQLILLQELNFKTENDVQPLLNELSEIQKMIYSFKIKLKNS